MYFLKQKSQLPFIASINFCCGTKLKPTPRLLDGQNQTYSRSLTVSNNTALLEEATPARWLAHASTRPHLTASPPTGCWPHNNWTPGRVNKQSGIDPSGSRHRRDITLHSPGPGPGPSPSRDHPASRRWPMTCGPLSPSPLHGEGAVQCTAASRRRGLSRRFSGIRSSRRRGCQSQSPDGRRVTSP